MSVGGFFGVDLRCWREACALGMNAAVAFLVQARGSGRDQRKSSWSINAIENYTGISRGRAREALQALLTAGLIRATRHGSHPQFEIRLWSELARNRAKLTRMQSALYDRIANGGRPDASQVRVADNLVKKGLLGRTLSGDYFLLAPKWVWLPNEFVTGAVDETPPLERIRQTQDVMTLRLAVELYHEQNLPEEGGVSRRVTWESYERFEVGQQAQYTVWGFRWHGRSVHWNDTTRPHRRDEGQLTQAEKEAGKNATVDFFKRIDVLADIGVVERLVFLVESEDKESEIIHPIAVLKGGLARLETRIGMAANDAAAVKLTQSQREWAQNQGLFLIPVPRHIGRVQVIGILRLRYRPKTKLTAAWWAEMETKGEQYLNDYGMMAAANGSEVGSGEHATSR